MNKFCRCDLQATIVPGVGIFLMVVAALKLYGFSSTGVPRIGWYATPSVQWAALTWEAVIGAWLLSGFAKPLGWLMAVCTFVTSTVVSSWLTYNGVSNYGCFGAIKTSPRLALAADLISLICLAVGRTQSYHAHERSFTSHVKVIADRLIIFSVITVTIWGGSTLFYGSFGNAVAYLSGRHYEATRLLDYGTVRPDETRTKFVTVKNLRSKPIEVVGGTSDCGCVSTSDLPLRIESGETATIPVTIQTSKSDGLQTVVMELLIEVDAVTRHEVVLTYLVSVTQ